MPSFTTPGVLPMKNPKFLKCYETERPGVVSLWASDQRLPYDSESEFLSTFLFNCLTYWFGEQKAFSLDPPHPMLLARLHVVFIKQHVVSSSRKETQNDSPFSLCRMSMNVVTTIGPSYMVLFRHVAWTLTNQLECFPGRVYEQGKFPMVC